MSDTVLTQTVQPWIKRSLILLPAILCNFYVTLPAKLDNIITANGSQIDNNYVWTSFFSFGLVINYKNFKKNHVFESLIHYVESDPWSNPI